MTPKPRCGLVSLFSGRWAWLTNTLTGSALFLIGDVIEQRMEIMRKKPNHQFDWERFKRIGLIGLFEGPPHYYFYRYLDRFLPGTTLVMVGKKIIIDQAVASPFFNVQFFVGMSLLEGKNLRDSWGEFVKKFPTVFLVDCLVWPPFQFINFYLIPTRLRVLYINVVTVFWNIFLSYMKHYDFYDKPGKLAEGPKDNPPG